MCWVLRISEWSVHASCLGNPQLCSVVLVSAGPTANKKQGSVHWCGNTFTNNNAVWCWCNSLFHSTALTQFQMYTAERVSGLQFFQRSPLLPSLFFCFPQRKGTLLSLCTTQIWTLQMSDAAGLTFACKILQNAPWRNAATRSDDAGSSWVTQRKEQIGLYAPPQPLLVNWIDLWKLFKDPQTILAQ